MFFSFSFSLFSFSILFVLYVCNNSYTVMGGQHRWAPAACHHIYFIIQATLSIFLLWLIKLLLCGFLSSKNNQAYCFVTIYCINFIFIYLCL